MDLNLQQVTELNKSLTDQEKHFNTLCGEYRKLASVWLLATFSAIGFALSQKQNLPMPPELFIALIGYAGIMGMLALWNMDIGVYHRLLDACFTEGLKLEEQYPALPQVRHNMMKLHAGRGVQPRVNWFYGLPAMLLLIISTWHMQLYLQLEGWKIWALWLGTIFMYSAFSFYIRNESTVNLRKKLK
jgi:hypothetical protein